MHESIVTAFIGTFVDGGGKLKRTLMHDNIIIANKLKAAVVHCCLTDPGPS